MGARNVGVHRCVWVKEGSMKNAGGLRLEQTIEFVNLLFYSESEKVKPSHFSFERYFWFIVLEVLLLDAMFAGQGRGPSQAFLVSSCLLEGS